MSFELEAACIFHGRAGSVAPAACNLAAAACSLHRVTMQDSKNEQASSYYDCTAHCSALVLLLLLHAAPARSRPDRKGSGIGRERYASTPSPRRPS